MSLTDYVDIESSQWIVGEHWFNIGLWKVKHMPLGNNLVKISVASNTEAENVFEYHESRKIITNGAYIIVHGGRWVAYQAYKFTRVSMFDYPWIAATIIVITIPVNGVVHLYMNSSLRM